MHAVILRAGSGFHADRKTVPGQDKWILPIAQWNGVDVYLSYNQPLWCVAWGRQTHTRRERDDLTHQRSPYRNPKAAWNPKVESLQPISDERAAAAPRFHRATFFRNSDQRGAGLLITYLKVSKVSTYEKINTYVVMNKYYNKWRKCWEVNIDGDGIARPRDDQWLRGTQKKKKKLQAAQKRTLLGRNLKIDDNGF